MKCRYSWTFAVAHFKMKTATFGHLILAVIETISASMAKINIEKLEERSKTYSIAARDFCFADFKLACYPVDVRFQCINRPTVTHGVVKPFFSGKPSLCGYKTAFSVLPLA